MEGSAQFKELFAVVMALDSISESFNLFTDRLYVVNLLPNLIKVDSNLISPLMIQAHSLLKQRLNPIYLQHIRGHQNLPEFLSKGNQLTDHLASMPQCNTVTEATDFHLLTMLTREA